MSTTEQEKQEAETRKRVRLEVVKKLDDAHTALEKSITETLEAHVRKYPDGLSEIRKELGDLSNAHELPNKVIEVVVELYDDIRSLIANLEDELVECEDKRSFGDKTAEVAKVVREACKSFPDKEDFFDDIAAILGVDETMKMSDFDGYIVMMEKVGHLRDASWIVGEAYDGMGEDE